MALRRRAQLGPARPGWFVRTYATAFGIAALIGLAIGVLWVIAGLLHFHPLW